MHCNSLFALFIIFFVCFSVSTLVTSCLYHTFALQVQLCKLKNLQLHKKLCEQRGDAGLEKFTASDGWMWRFSRRHGIRQLMLQGEKLSANKPAAEEFCGTFQEFVEDNHYTLNQIFNCDETGLYYKLMPQ